MSETVDQSATPDPKETAIGLYLALCQQGVSPKRAFAEAIKQLAAFYPEMTPQQGSLVMSQAIRNYAKANPDADALLLSIDSLSDTAG